MHNVKCKSRILFALVFCVLILCKQVVLADDISGGVPPSSNSPGDDAGDVETGDIPNSPDIPPVQELEEIVDAILPVGISKIPAEEKKPLIRNHKVEVQNHKVKAVNHSFTPVDTKLDFTEPISQELVETIAKKSAKKREDSKPLENEPVVLEAEKKDAQYVQRTPKEAVSLEDGKEEKTVTFAKQTKIPSALDIPARVQHIPFAAAAGSVLVLGSGSGSLLWFFLFYKRRADLMIVSDKGEIEFLRFVRLKKTKKGYKINLRHKMLSDVQENLFCLQNSASTVSKDSTITIYLEGSPVLCAPIEEKMFFNL